MDGARLSDLSSTPTPTQITKEVRVKASKNSISSNLAVCQDEKDLDGHHEQMHGVASLLA